MKLADIASQLGCEYQGDGTVNVDKLCAIDNIKPNSITYLRDKKHLSLVLGENKPEILILTKELSKFYDDNCLIVTDPYYTYSVISQLLYTDKYKLVGVHSSAVISKTSKLGENTSIGANTIIEDNVIIGKNCIIHAGCIIEQNCKIGDNSKLFPRVTVNEGTQIGESVRIQSGAVLGSEGFGYANHNGKWSRISQTGKVFIGNNVEIGANTTIDRGAINNTIIEDGVILDNQIQIAHNVKIGKNTAIAGCVGIAGSAIIGEDCTIGGGAVILGHLRIANNVHITAMSLVTKSINKAGKYSSGGILEESISWKKNAVRFKQLDKLFRKLKIKSFL